jgi:cytochrome c553
MEKRHDGWRFVEFAGESRSEIAVDGAKAVTACAACHAMAQRDQVFSQFAE